jgi:hypothetical protein
MSLSGSLSGSLWLYENRAVRSLCPGSDVRTRTLKEVFRNKRLCLSGNLVRVCPSGTNPTLHFCPSGQSV